MTKTTRVISVTVPVADQDAALAFYTEVLGCELRYDVEVWPGARMVEVVPPGSEVGLVLLPPDTPLPIAIKKNLRLFKDMVAIGERVLPGQRNLCS